MSIETHDTALKKVWETIHTGNIPEDNPRYVEEIREIARQSDFYAKFGTPTGLQQFQELKSAFEKSLTTWQKDNPLHAEVLDVYGQTQIEPLNQDDYSKIEEANKKMEIIRGKLNMTGFNLTVALWEVGHSDGNIEVARENLADRNIPVSVAENLLILYQGRSLQDTINTTSNTINAITNYLKT